MSGRQEPTTEMCSRRCGAKCCRAPVILQVTNDELAAMMALCPETQHNGRTDEYIDSLSGAVVSRTTLRFADEPGQRCPFLDGGTNLCTVYDARPASCRGFPDRPESWCLAWAE